MQLVITEGTDEEEIPVFKSNTFKLYCNSSINAEIEQPEEYAQWIEIANTKINELNEAINRATQVAAKITQDAEEGEFNGQSITNIQINENGELVATIGRI